MGECKDGWEASLQSPGQLAEGGTLEAKVMKGWRVVLAYVGSAGDW